MLKGMKTKQIMDDKRCKCPWCNTATVVEEEEELMTAQEEENIIEELRSQCGLT